MVTFKEATDALGLTAPELAEHLGVSPQSIRQMRLDPSSEGYRSPPEGWQKIIARLARARGGELARLAQQLEG